jgi:hypothetical protein
MFRKVCLGERGPFSSLCILVGNAGEGTGQKIRETNRNRKIYCRERERGVARWKKN